MFKTNAEREGLTFALTKLKTLYVQIADSSETAWINTPRGGRHFGILYNYPQGPFWPKDSTFAAIFTHARHVSYKPKIWLTYDNNVDLVEVKYETALTPQLGLITPQLRSLDVDETDLSSYIAKLALPPSSRYSLGFMANSQIHKLILSSSIRWELGIPHEHELKLFSKKIISQFVYDLLQAYLKNGNITILRQTESTINMLTLTKEGFGELGLAQIFKEIDDIKNSLDEDEFFRIVTNFWDSESLVLTAVEEIEFIGNINP